MTNRNKFLLMHTYSIWGKQEKIKDSRKSYIDLLELNELIAIFYVKVQVFYTDRFDLNLKFVDSIG